MTTPYSIDVNAAGVIDAYVNGRRSMASPDINGGSIDGAIIGANSAAAGSFTTLSATGVITSTVSTGTAPFSIASTTVVPNLNVSQLLGATWAAPGTIGSGTPNTGAFTTLSSSGLATLNSLSVTTTAGVTGDFTVNTNKFVVTASSGNATCAGTFQSDGNLTCGASVNSNNVLQINANSSKLRNVRWSSVGVRRWEARCTNAAESGSNAGSNWDLVSYNDAGTEIDRPIQITRAAGGTMQLSRPILIGTTLQVNGNTTLGDASTDTITCTGRLIVRSVTDAGPMTATNGTAGEIVRNTSDNKFYGCTVTGNPATWVALN